MRPLAGISDESLALADVDPNAAYEHYLLSLPEKEWTRLQNRIVIEQIKRGEMSTGDEDFDRALRKTQENSDG